MPRMSTRSCPADGASFLRNRTLLTILVCALLATACGGGGDDAEDANADVEVTTTTAATGGEEPAADIEAYIMVVEYEEEVMGMEIVQILTLELTANDLSGDIPGNFLVANRTYKIEVGAVEESGNTTFTEIEVDTVDDIPN